MRLISRHPLKFITLFIISSFMNCSVVFAAQDGNIKQQTNTQTPATTNVTVKQVLLVRHAEKSQIIAKILSLVRLECKEHRH